MFIPYSTDAPIYHWPVATVGLIVANTVIFFAVLSGSISDPEYWVLPYGEGLTPVQWLLSMFMHADFEHLLGNMLFLWVFGLVVEGKIGWYRFLGCYLAIGIGQSMGEQTLQLMLGGQGDSLGASSAIYGIMAMAAVWAPKNEVSFFYWLFLFYGGTFEVSIMWLSFFYIGLDVLGWLLLGFSSSSWLHVGGALLGAPLAVMMLKSGHVDCEKWDLFHLWNDDLGGHEEKRRKQDPQRLAKRQEKRDSQILENGPAQIQQFLDEGNVEAAYKLYGKLENLSVGIRLDKKPLLAMIAHLHRGKRWQESCPLMSDLIQRFPDDSQLVNVKLAQICVVELQKPVRALELLNSLDLHQLPPNTLTLVKKIALKAKQMQAAGVLELDDQRW